MKRLYCSLFLIITGFSFFSCNDQCTETRYVRQTRPVTLSLTGIRQAGIVTEAARTMERPGKLYVKENYLFINELKKGIHIIDNSNPSNPTAIAFVNIPGNGDMAVRGNILYVDSYTDIVALDISNPKQVTEVSRVQDLFNNGLFDGGYWAVNMNTGAIQDQEVSYVTEKIKTNCEDNITPIGWGWGWFSMDALFASSSSLSSGGKSSSSSDGVGGSMARFALHSQFLYTVDQSNLNLLDISDPGHPDFYKTIPVGWNIETIFPYGNNLFIGSGRGMYIFDNSNPSDPQQLSVYQHNVACDPVVVHENLAYVTLRSGTTCNLAQNQLDVIDIADLSNPKLLKSYPMKHPHGLSIDNPRLYLCEGEYGLKVFDVSNPMEIDQHQISHIADINAFDVITIGSNLLLIGKDGFYQYNAADPKRLKLLSKIPVSSPF